MNNNIAVKKILKLSTIWLNKKKVSASDYAFHTEDKCNGKILILTRFSEKNIEGYIKTAYDNGVKGLIVDKHVPMQIVPDDLPIHVSKFLINDLNIFLSNIYNKPLNGKKVIGVTGTDGKTSMIHLLAQSYIKLGKKVGVISTEGNGIYPILKKTSYTTPRNDLLFKFFDLFDKKSIDIILIECSSQGLHQGRLNYIDFDISLVTNITRDHLDYHKNYLNYIKSKCILLNMTKKAIFLNKDCKNNNQILKLTSTSAKIIYFNNNYKISGHKTKLFDSTSNQYNLSSLYSILKYSKNSDRDIISIFENLNPIPGRNNIIQKKGFAKFIIDYAHTNHALTSLLRDIHKKYNKNYNKIIIVFGCGGDRDSKKRLAMGRTADKYCDHIILTDDNPRSEQSIKIIKEIAKGISDEDKVIELPNRKHAIKKSIKISNKDDIVIIAGKGNEETINYESNIEQHNDIKYLKYLLNEY